VRYTDFSDLGDSGTRAIYSYPHNFIAPATFDIRNSTFTRCGAIAIDWEDGDSVFRFLNNSFSSSLDSWNLGFSPLSALTTGVRLITNNSFDKSFGGTDPFGGCEASMTITSNVIGSGLRLYSTGGSTFASNVVFGPNALSGGETVLYGSASNLVLINDTSTNPHILYTVFAPAVATFTYDGLIIEYAGAGNDGDGISGNFLLANTMVIQNSIFLRSATSSDTAATTISSWGNTVTAAPLSAYHNTFRGSGNFDKGLFFNECVTCTPAGTIANYRGNLYWDDAIPVTNNPPVGAGANHFMYQGTPNDNVLADSGASHNTCWMCKLATVAGPASGTYYNVPLAVGQTVPGTNDLNINPGLADPSRRVETWAVTKGQAATLAGSKLALAVNPTAMIPDLLNYLRAGNAPTNVALATAAHDGTWIGAVKPVGLFGGF
jgi:hypothetical protein